MKHRIRPLGPANARGAVAGLAIVLFLAGCFGAPGGPATADGSDRSAGAEEPFRARVVVAVIDTGIQPYHEEFHQRVEDPWAHPSTLLAGYPPEAEGLALSLDAEDLDAARELDADLWAGTAPETLYWIPGTKIVGLIGIGIGLPGGGHGTMVSSRIAGNSVSIGGQDVLLVNVRTGLALFNENPGRAVRWAADQPWIDIQSNSWGTPFMCVGPATDSMTGWLEAFRYASAKQPTFVAVHNGHGNTGTLGYPSQCQDTAGPADVIAVGGVDNGGLVRWANHWPYIAADACNNPTADEAAMTGTVNRGGGTSSATPFSAGGAAKILLEARTILRDPTVGVKPGGVLATAHEGAILPDRGPLADGVLTMDELRLLLFRTAISPPVGDASDGDECGGGARIPIPSGTPPEALYPFIGYGEVNNRSVARAIDVLRGDASLPERTVEDGLYARDYALRQALWG